MNAVLYFELNFKNQKKKKSLKENCIVRVLRIYNTLDLTITR